MFFEKDILEFVTKESDMNDLDENFQQMFTETSLKIIGEGKIDISDYGDLVASLIMLKLVSEKINLPQKDKIKTQQCQRNGINTIDTKLDCWNQVVFSTDDKNLIPIVNSEIEKLEVKYNFASGTLPRNRVNLNIEKESLSELIRIFTNLKVLTI